MALTNTNYINADINLHNSLTFHILQFYYSTCKIMNQILRSVPIYCSQWLIAYRGLGASSTHLHCLFPLVTENQLSLYNCQFGFSSVVRRVTCQTFCSTLGANTVCDLQFVCIFASLNFVTENLWSIQCVLFIFHFHNHTLQSLNETKVRENNDTKTQVFNALRLSVNSYYKFVYSQFKSLFFSQLINKKYIPRPRFNQS